MSAETHLRSWIEAAGRAGIIRRARVGFFARLLAALGLEVVPDGGDFSEAWQRGLR